MSNNLISLPGLAINGFKIAYVPESIQITTGRGEVKVLAEILGAGVSATVHGVDGTTLVGVIAFKMYSRASNINIFNSLKAVVGASVVKITDTASGSYLSMSNASVSSDNAIALSSDGSFDVEVKGDPMVLTFRGQ